MAVVFGVYERLINLIANIRRDLKKELPFILCFGLMLVAYVYGVLTHRISTFSTFKSFLSSGFVRYGALIVLSMLLSFIFHCFCYIFAF